MKNEILKLKKEKDAIILAHYYTLSEVQDVADFVGDSLALARKAAQTNAQIILFAGVHFMAETAKILNPSKKVLIPDIHAGCSLADGCNENDLKQFMDEHPDYLLLSYVNCSAKVKAMSDIIVTSGNALKIVNALPKDAKIVFAPDKNLGHYINEMTKRNMLLWDGACHVHNEVTAQMIQKQKKLHPQAVVVAHPECPANALQLADFVGSTAAMLNFVALSPAPEFIVVTENGIFFEMQKQNPSKKLFLVDNNTGEPLNCEYMKRNTLQNILHTLQTEQPELLLDPDLIEQAKKPIEKMLELS